MPKVNAEQVNYNLLKGWMDAGGSSRLPTLLAETGRQVLIIDDDYCQYRDAFSQIIGEHNIIEFFNDDYSPDKFKEDHDLSGFNNRLNAVIFSCCLVISDLYITENHGSEFHSTPENADQISGFIINREIKKISPMLPVMMFTGSNKVWNYRLFDSYGIDEWVVKFDSPFTGNADAAVTRSFYENFETAIQNLIVSKPYLALMDFYSNINNLPVNALWWEIPGTSRRSEIVMIVNESLMAFKKSLNKQFNYERLLIGQNKIYDSDVYTCSAIISQLGNIVEIIYELFDRKSNRDAGSIEDHINLFIFRNRNLAAHNHGYKHFTIEDVYLALTLINFELPLTCSKKDFIDSYKRRDECRLPNEFRLLWNILLLHNEASGLTKEIKRLLRKRAKNYLSSIFSNSSGQINIDKLKSFRASANSNPETKLWCTKKGGPPSYSLAMNGTKLIVELKYY
jgi:hypothetical protein